MEEFESSITLTEEQRENIITKQNLVRSQIKDLFDAQHDVSTLNKTTNIRENEEKIDDDSNENHEASPTQKASQNVNTLDIDTISNVAIDDNDTEYDEEEKEIVLLPSLQTNKNKINKRKRKRNQSFNARDDESNINQNQNQNKRKRRKLNRESDKLLQTSQEKEFGQINAMEVMQEEFEKIR